MVESRYRSLEALIFPLIPTPTSSPRRSPHHFNRVANKLPLRVIRASKEKLILGMSIVGKLKMSDQPNYQSSEQLPIPNSFSKKILRSPKRGPVQEEVLDNLLFKVEAALKQEINQSCPDQALGGIRLGYQIEHPDQSNQTVESYWVGLGQAPLYEKLLKYTELPSQEEPAKDGYEITPSADDCLSDTLINQLIDTIQASLCRTTPADAISGDHLHAWFFAHTVRKAQGATESLKVLQYAGNTGCCCNSNRRRRNINGYCTGGRCC